MGEKESGTVPHPTYCCSSVGSMYLRFRTQLIDQVRLVQSYKSVQSDSNEKPQTSRYGFPETGRQTDKRVARLGNLPPGRGAPGHAFDSTGG